MAKLDERMPEHIKKIVIKQKHNNKLFLLVFGGYITIIWLFSYLIPSNILTLYPSFGEFIQWLGGWIPSIERFGRLSAFPQVAQVLFVLEILTIPLLIKFSFNQAKHVNHLIGLKWIFVIAGSILIFYFYFFHLPGDGVGPGFSSRISRSIANSHFIFALWTSMFAFGAAMILGGILKNLSKRKSDR
ncbi:MAG: hypothetical protein GXP14_11845 [Gammaproteobacteria bacterium]|nr:hypothetical protein [Gammaproteobacteria bacterium]